MADGEFVRQVRASSEEAHQYLHTGHPARGRYRVAAMLIGLLMGLVGLVALVIAGDVPFAGRHGHGFLGLTLNRAGGLMFLVLAVAVVLAALMQGNTGAIALMGTAMFTLLLGLFVLAVNRTSVNVFAFSIIDVCVLWIAALGVLWCGMHTFEGAEHGREHITILGSDRSEYRETS